MRQRVKAVHVQMLIPIVGIAIGLVLGGQFKGQGSGEKADGIESFRNTVPIGNAVIGK